MDGWESLVDQKIREAIERGEFADLSGQGQPIDLSENPFEDPAWRMGHRMLRNAGFAPAWIEERKDIDAELTRLRADLMRVWRVLENARSPEHKHSAEVRWETGLKTFKGKVAELNRRIDAWNLKAPGVGFHRTRINFEREIDAIKS